MRIQWTTKGNRDAGSSCSCNRGFHRYLRNFGGLGGCWTPQTPHRYVTVLHKTFRNYWGWVFLKKNMFHNWLLK